MRFRPADMLIDIERNIDFVPAGERAKLEPIIAQMNAGQVTSITKEQSTMIHRVHVLHCLSDARI